MSCKFKTKQKCYEQSFDKANKTKAFLVVLQGWWPTTSEEEENVVTGSAVSTERDELLFTPKKTEHDAKIVKIVNI